MRRGAAHRYIRLDITSFAVTRLLPRLLIAALLASAALPARADSARIAAATNFAPTAERLAADYGETSGHEIAVTAGATGKLYAQIIAGAPFDAFLAADQATAARLAAEGRGVPASRFAYATGRLMLWSANPETDLADPARALRAVRHVAVANPDLSPYGKAALQAIETMGLSAELSGRLVIGENIGQAQTMIASGAADIGFIAASGLPETSGGAAWPVPERYHAPIRQDAILLKRGASNPAATGFLDYLKTPEARAVIATAGYGAD